MNWLHKILQVFHKAEEANNKMIKYFIQKYFDSKLNKDGIQEVSNVPKDFDMKDINNKVKVKGDMINKPSDQNEDLILINVLINKDVNEALKQFKNKGDLA